MNLSASSAKPADPTYFLEGIIHDKSEMADFEGPLSLILLLLSKNKIEIRDIKISEILDQYLEYLNAMEKLDLEIASEFVQMASYLLYIKTRMLLTEEKEVTGARAAHRVARAAQVQGHLCGREVRYADARRRGPDRPALPVAPAGAAAEVGGGIPLPHRAGRPPACAAVGVHARRRGGDGCAADGGARSASSTACAINAARSLTSCASRGSMSLNTLYSQCTSRSEIVATFLSVLELCSLGHLMLSEQNGEYVASFTGGATDDILESIVE